MQYLHQPRNENQQAIHDAFTILANKRDKANLSAEQLLRICQRDPRYALQMIAVHATPIRHTSDWRPSANAPTVTEVEWVLKGASTFIEDHYIGTETEIAKFIHKKIIERPDEFPSEVLNKMLRCFKPAHSLHKAALDALANYVSALADRLATEPTELSQDIQHLKHSIREYGFSNDLNAVLTKVDDELQQQQDAFDQAATMRHIRSFFEKLHESIARELQAKKPGAGDKTPLHQCGQAIDYLERKGVTTDKIRQLGRCLYSILSDSTYGVHALKAERDYTRLCRNMVVEYAVALFFELERRLAQPGND